MKYVIRMLNEGGELDCRYAVTQEQAKAVLLKMIEELAHVTEGDRFEITREETRG
jgi:hypothetical protein